MRCGREALYRPATTRRTELLQRSPNHRRDGCYSCESDGKRINKREWEIGGVEIGIMNEVVERRYYYWSFMSARSIANFSTSLFDCEKHL